MGCDDILDIAYVIGSYTTADSTYARPKPRHTIWQN